MEAVWTAGALIIFSGVILMVLLHGPGALQRCYRDLFGTMIVTDRRIAWLSPFSREVYREVSSAEIVDAFVVEDDDRRGWIGIVRFHRGNVEDSTSAAFLPPRLLCRLSCASCNADGVVNDASESDMPCRTSEKIRDVRNLAHSLYAHLNARTGWSALAQ